MTCDQCKYWKPKETALWPKPNPIEYHMVCSHRAFGVGGSGIESEDGLDVDVHHYADGTGDICTGPKFGCIHFEQK